MIMPEMAMPSARAGSPICSLNKGGLNNPQPLLPFALLLGGETSVRVMLELYNQLLNAITKVLPKRNHSDQELESIF